MRYGFTRNFLPSVSDNIRREVSCPVLVVPQPEIIPKREQRLNRWLAEWLAYRESTMMLDTRVLNQTRGRGWTQQITSLYTDKDSELLDQKDESSRSS